jgi:hypothetical protein
MGRSGVDNYHIRFLALLLLFPLLLDSLDRVFILNTRDDVCLLLSRYFFFIYLCRKGEISI